MRHIIHCIKWLWQAAKGGRGRLLLVIILGLTRTAVSLLFIWCTKILVDIATGHSGQDIYMFSGLLACCLVMQIAISAASVRINATTAVRMRNRIRHVLFLKVMESRWKGRESIHSGDILDRIEKDVSTVTEVLCRAVPALAVTSFQLCAAMILLGRLDYRLVICIFVLMAAAMLLSRRFVIRVRNLNRQIREDDSEVHSHIQENIQHKTVIAALERVPEMSDTLSSMQENLEGHVSQRANYSVFSRVMMQAGVSSGYAIMLLWGVFGIMHGTVTFGTMTAFMQLVAQIQRPMAELGRLVPAFIQVSTAIERLSDLYDMQEEEKGRPVKMPGRIGIRMQDVTFAYPGDVRPVLERLSHDFKPGSITAVMGATGTGKSTLIRLLLALIKPDKGLITIYDGENGIPVSPLTRCNIIYVPQGNTLISGTVRDNLLLGNPDASDDDMRKVLHTAVADFVLDLPDGLDTVCGESGAGLSEGQAQRIAIARGLLKSGGIILLDEPTSALDKETEKELLSRLSKSESGKTIIIVSHSEIVADFCGNRIVL